MKKKKKNSNALIHLSGVGLQLGMTVWLGAKCGEWLDGLYPNENEWFTKGVVLLSISIGFYYVFQQVSKFEDE